MYKIAFTSKYQKDYILSAKRGWDVQALNNVVRLLVSSSSLPASCKNHKLTGNYNGYYECHIKPDWLLIYKKDDELMIITLVRTGTHSDLF